VVLDSVLDVLVGDRTGEDQVSHTVLMSLRGVITGWRTKPRAIDE
jgi:hypothetical protein